MPICGTAAFAAGALSLTHRVPVSCAIREILFWDSYLNKAVREAKKRSQMCKPTFKADTLLVANLKAFNS